MGFFSSMEWLFVFQVLVPCLETLGRCKDYFTVVYGLVHKRYSSFLSLLFSSLLIGFSPLKTPRFFNKPSLHEFLKHKTLQTLLTYSPYLISSTKILIPYLSPIG